MDLLPSRQNQAAKSFVTLIDLEEEPGVPLLAPLPERPILVYCSLLDTKACILSNYPKKLALVEILETRANLDSELLVIAEEKIGQGLARRAGICCA
jgi:hypothetical protein